MRYLAPLIAAVALGACTSVGQVGLITRSSMDPAALLRSGRPFKDLGPAHGKACRFLVLGAFPWGDADLQTAVDQALAPKGGDGLVSVTATNSLYGFIPIYNVFSYTCTTVDGFAIKFEPYTSPQTINGSLDQKPAATSRGQ
jgi:hypothetical protein